MFSKRGNNILSTVTFRLTLWYSILLAVLSLSVFIFVYIWMAISLQHNLDKVLLDDAKEFRSIYERDGIDSLKKEFQLEATYEGVKRVFFRMFSPQLDVLATSDMKHWKDIGLPPATLKSSSSNKELLMTVSMPGYEHKVRVIYEKTANGNIIEAGHALRDNDALMNRYRQTFGWGFLGILALSSIGGWSLAERAMSGVKRVTQTAVSIANEGNLIHRVPVGNEGREIRNLALAFNNMLERIQSLVSELREVTDNIAHDLRSPVTRIRGIAETTLTSNEKLDTYREMTATIIEECDRLVGMINTMLEIAETKAGAANFEDAPVDIVKIVKDAHELFQPVAEDKNITLELNVQNGVKTVLVAGDTTRLQRAMANLLDNAVKYTDSGGKVTVSVEQMQTQAKISVSDTGLGIDEKDITRIFDRFYRVDTSRSTAGNGLGLSLAHTIVQAHKGRIVVESTPGKGSTFTIIIPCISNTN
ncbi:MAG: HAMP domain-containing sensor histidine kinase [Sedimentisphaerales bacterium]